MAEQDNAQQQEPTMEEILASIRRIISEDGDEHGEAAQEPEPARPEPARAQQSRRQPEPVRKQEPEQEPAAEVLELTEVVAEEKASKSSRSGRKGGVREPSVEDEVVMIEKGMANQDTEAMVEAVSPHSEEGNMLLSPEKATVAASAFHELSKRVRISEGEAPTLEALVQDMMRPMLKQWLDTNLPRLVEKIVEREVRRIAVDE